jgi:hypothetical protein
MLAEAEEGAAALAKREVPDPVEARLGPWIARAQGLVGERIAAAHTRLEQLKEELRRAPHRDLLERSIARVVGRLEPREIAQFRGLVTETQAIIAFKVREVAKDILLGREREE